MSEFSHRQWRLAVLGSHELTDGQKVDILTRGEHCHFETGQNSYISQVNIAKLNGHYRQQVLRSDHAGEEMGLLSLSQERKGQTNIYRLTMPPVTEEAHVPEEAQVPVPEEAQGCASGSTGGVPEGAHEHKREHEKNTNIKQSAPRGDATSDPASDSGNDAQSPGPRAKRDTWESVAGSLRKHFLPDANTQALVSRMRAAARPHKLDAEDMDILLVWWLTNGAPTEFGIWLDGGTIRTENDKAIVNPAGWFMKIIPDLVQSWIDAGRPAHEEES